MTDRDSRFAHVDAMRAIAVMLVVISHAGLADRVPGGSGVTIFFGISGFIITFLLLKERHRTGIFDIQSFYARRALKILPPLTLVVIIPSLILGFFSPINWQALWGVIFFYFNWLFLNGVGEPFPGSAVVWSLSIEEQFYIMFAIMWALALKFRVRIIIFGVGVAMIAFASLLTRVWLATFSNLSGEALENRIYYATDTRIEAIALGILSAFIVYWSVNGRARQPGIEYTVGSFAKGLQTDSALMIAIFIFVASLAVRNEWFRCTARFSIQALAACVVIIYGFGTANTYIRKFFNWCTQRKTVQVIGLASYSIYLAHLTVIHYSKPFVVGLTPLLQTGLLALAGVLVGIGIYMLVERPVQLWKKRRLETR